MAYQIRYGINAVTKTRKRERRLPKISRETRLRFGFGLSILLLVLSCLIPHVRLVIRDVLLPGDPEVTAQALERLVEAMSQGQGIQTAVTDFCREVMEGGLQAA